MYTSFGPEMVPVAGTIMILGIVAVSKAHDGYVRRLQFEERMAAVARGLPLPEPIAISPQITTMSLNQRNRNIRLGGIICVAGAIGAVLFFFLLYLIIGQREILSGAAAALIPLGIGAGLLIDARINSHALRDLSAGN